MTKLTINDIALTVGSGITPLRSNASFWDNPKFPWLKTEQLGEFQIFDTTEYISQTALEQTNIKLWPQKTISIAMYGEGKTRGNTSIIMREMATNQACCNVIVNPEVADYRFLYYWIKSNYEQLRMLSSGVRKNLNSEDIKGFSFPDTKLDIQRDIADVLYAIDLKILNNSRIIAELEAMSKTIYDYWFVQFDYPNEDGRPYRSSSGEMKWNEQLKKEIPTGWTSCKIGDLLAKVPNTTRIQSTEYLNSGSIPVVDQSDAFIAGYTEDRSSIIPSKNGTIVFGDHTRIVKYIGFDFARGADGTQVIISNCDRMPQLLFYHSILKIDLSNYGYARHFKFLKETDIIVPCEHVARSFSSIVSPFHETITKKVFENIELAKLRDWLLSMLMNGQVRVE